MRVLLIIIYFSFIAVVNGQNVPNLMKVKVKKAFKLGIRGGLNFSDLYKANPLNDPVAAVSRTGNDPYLGVDFGGMGGIFVKYSAGMRMEMQGELHYTKKGGSFNLHGYKYQIKLRYLDMQLLAGAKMFDMFTVKTGMVFGVLVSAKSITDNIKEDFSKDYYTPILGGVILSLGYYTYEGVLIDARAEMSFTNINNTKVESRDFYLSSIMYQLSVGYIIPLFD